MVTIDKSTNDANAASQGLLVRYPLVLFSFCPLSLPGAIWG